MPVDLSDPCSIRPKGVRVRSQRHEIDIGIRASGSASMRANQTDGAYFRLRCRPSQDDLKDRLNPLMILRYALPRSHSREIDLEPLAVIRLSLAAG
jgi:hypothetical protein